MGFSRGESMNQRLIYFIFGLAMFLIAIPQVFALNANITVPMELRNNTNGVVVSNSVGVNASFFDALTSGNMLGLSSTYQNLTTDANGRLFPRFNITSLPSVTNRTVFIEIWLNNRTPTDRVLVSPAIYAANSEGIVNAANISIGTLPEGRLPTTLTGTYTYSGAISVTGDLSATLNASNVTSGQLADARLSSNIVRLATFQTFSRGQTFDPSNNDEDSINVVGSDTPSRENVFVIRNAANDKDLYIFKKLRADFINNVNISSDSVADIYIFNVTNRNMTIKANAAFLYPVNFTDRLNITDVGSFSSYGTSLFNVTSPTAFRVGSPSFNDVFLIDTTTRNLTIKGDVGFHNPINITVDSTKTFRINSPLFDEIFLIDTTLRNFTIKGDIGITGGVNITNVLNVTANSLRAFRVARDVSALPDIIIDTEHNTVNSTNQNVTTQLALGTNAIRINNATGYILDAALNSTAITKYFNNSAVQKSEPYVFTQAGRINITNQSSAVLSSVTYAVVTMPRAYTNSVSYAVTANIIANETQLTNEASNLPVYGAYIIPLSGSQFNLTLRAGTSFQYPININWIAVGY